MATSGGHALFWGLGETEVDQSLLRAHKSVVERVLALGGDTYDADTGAWAEGAPKLVHTTATARSSLVGHDYLVSGRGSDALSQDFDPWRPAGQRGSTYINLGGPSGPWEVRPSLEHFDGDRGARSHFVALVLRAMSDLYLVYARLEPLARRAQVLAELCELRSGRPDLLEEDLELDVGEVRRRWTSHPALAGVPEVYGSPADVLAGAVARLDAVAGELRDQGLVWATGSAELVGDLASSLRIDELGEQLGVALAHTGGCWMLSPSADAFSSQLLELDGPAPYRYIAATYQLHRAAGAAYWDAFGSSWSQSGTGVLWGQMDVRRVQLDKSYRVRGSLQRRTPTPGGQADVVQRRLGLVGQRELADAAVAADRLLAASRPVRLLVVGPQGCGTRRVARTLVALHQERKGGADKVKLTEPDVLSWRAETTASNLVLKSFAGAKDDVVHLRGIGAQVGRVAGAVALEALDLVLSGEQAPAAVVAEASEAEFVQLMTAAPNLLRRFQVVRTSAFAGGDVAEVALSQAREAGWSIEEEALVKLVEEYEAVRPTDTFCNARIVEHLVHRAGTNAVLAGRTALTAADFTATESPLRVAQPMLDETLAELDNIIGLDSLKRDLEGLAAEATFWASRREQNLPATIQPSRHMVFTGEPGTAKTTVARIVSRIYSALGLLNTGQVIEVTRADLVAGWIGHTAPKVREVVHQARGGVLFIDEAYSLYQPDNPRDFGLEAITELLRCMEEYRDDLVVIVAGYEDEMDVFLSANPGLSSRFPKRWGFPRYSVEQLVEIFQVFTRTHAVACGPGVDEAVAQSIEAAMEMEDFGNGRTVRNLFEASVERAARRSGRAGSSTLQLTAADVLGDQVVVSQAHTAWEDLAVSGGGDDATGDLVPGAGTGETVVPREPSVDGDGWQS